MISMFIYNALCTAGQYSHLSIYLFIFQSVQCESVPEEKCTTVQEEECEDVEEEDCSVTIFNFFLIWYNVQH